MDRNLYNAASEGKVDVLRQHFDQLESQATANRNTALHVAAQFGQLQCVAAILEVCPSLLRRVNNRGETPLHMAAREGYSDIVKALIEFAIKIEQELESGWSGEGKKMLRATNVDGDTALHMAVQNCHFKKVKDKYLEVVRLLTREDPEFQHPTNNAKETPLYLAAEQGSEDVVVTLLETCTSPTYGGPGGRTALHAAALKDYFAGRLTKALLEWKKDLIKQADEYGWTPLHYAACNKSGTGSVTELLAMDILVAYITTTNKDGLETALHIAAAHGHVSVIEELLSYNPDCWEMVNSKGQNALHIAVDMNRDSVIRYILRKSWVGQLINQKDNEGNTPLHLLIASDGYANELWTHDRADHHAFNGKSMTPVDLVWSDFMEERMSTFAERYIVDETFMDSAGIGGGRNLACNAHVNLAKLEKARTNEIQKREMRKETEIRRKEEAKDKEKHDAFELSVNLFQTLVIVAALIATITFAAAFTIPGGYDGNQGRDQGMAILARESAFIAFVVTNTIAMVCSVTSIFLCLAALLYSVSDDEEAERYLMRYIGAVGLIIVSMFFLMIAFIAATFAVLAHAIALAVSTCIIACFAFIGYIVELRKFIPRALAWKD
ncbi:ankyrin repeat-containing protein At5g02620-like [Rhododendron vialii]|uniref:ankyrin repeat-containing protein At5g02620-like n=1 Tax=Rhododendron vialii TaxID=182163 RepID=UPI00265EA130|nr:ankyrin repeat-containing protein At5g02620-like [Rhododendron vialii]